MQQQIRFLTDRNGRTIAYSVTGSGPLLICPAWWVSHVEHDWQDAAFREFFGRLAQHFAVVRYDRLGVGLSDRRQVAADLAEETDTLVRLFDHLDCQRASLLALSCAGPVALRFAALYPHRVDKLCFVNSYASGADLATEELRRAMLQLVKAHWGFGSKTLADIFAPAASGSELAALSKNQQLWSSGKNATALLQLAYTMDASTDARRINTPSLVVHRRYDRAIPFEAGRRLASLLPHAELQVFDSGTHLPWMQANGELDAICNFLAPSCAPTFKGVSAPIQRPLSDRTSQACAFDQANRAIVIDGARRSLTPLEFKVLSLLQEAPDRVVCRDTLLNKAWRQPFAGSNKVDAVMRTLRKKLGPYALSIETVTGHGYRFSAWRRTEL